MLPRQVSKLVFLLILPLGAWASADTSSCPETLLKDFKRKVETKAEATKIFADYFSKQNGFVEFDPAQIKSDDSPSCSGSNKKAVCYFYFDWYGMGPKGVGGYLYPNGRLVKRGYCK